MGDSREQQLAHDLREGKIEAWHALYDAYARLVWRSVARLLGPASADVADVVQETFLAAARSAKSYDPAQGNLGLWLLGILRRQVAIHNRKKEQQGRLREAAERLVSEREKVLGWLDDGHPTPPEALASAEMAALVRSALAELPADYGSLLAARYLDDTSVEDLAGTHQCTPSTMRTKLARARKAFREMFGSLLCPFSQDSQPTGRP